jgi:FixJ family two-component response regulator
MVLDDEPAVLELLCDFLALEGFETLGYANPSQFPCMERTDCPAPPGSACCSAVVTDLAMPEISGLDLLRHLRAIGCRCPAFAVVSGQLTDTVRCDIEAMGVATFDKPGVFPALTNWLRDVRTELPSDWALSEWPPPGTDAPPTIRGGWPTA